MMLECLIAAWWCVGAALPETVLVSFDDPDLPPGMVCNHTRVERVPAGDGQALRVAFDHADWPNVYFAPADGGPWDWSAHAGLAVDVRNPGPDPVAVCIRVDNAGADGMNACNTTSATVGPGERVTIRAYFLTGEPGPFWGMRGVPERGPLGQGMPIDPARITAFQVFLPLPDKPRTLILDNIRLFGTGGPLEGLVPMPFVDRFGQYIHADWPGKLSDERDWPRRRAAEEEDLARRPQAVERDRFGGWAAGPQLEATGWFRTERVNGKWWLVTPEGRLFFSSGVDCVGTWEQTFVEGRSDWFDGLAEAEGPYAAFYGRQSGVHSMAEAIGGEGRTFNFYGANLYRKYGDDWRALWRDTAVRRLKSWGFNTIGNWSQTDVIEAGDMPFTATCGISGPFRRVEGGAGYWGKMPDPYDPAFAEAAEAAIAAAAERYADNPLCIGYFVDNELSWGTPSGWDIAAWTLASPPDQPGRQAFVARLQQRYGDLDGLTRAWQTSASEWDDLRAPAAPNQAAQEDLGAFIHAFARQYFDIVRDTLRRHAPNHLYLGCRFSTAHSQVVKACAEVADVLSFNLYQTTIDCAAWTGEKDLGKPILIGEFHFGALDRGMFHPGLVPARDQDHRAQSFARYVESVADCPAFVGCHWFQYVDEPVTGRFYDGENYNIGFVTVTDTPYPEMVEAARATHATVYGRRYGREP